MSAGVGRFIAASLAALLCGCAYVDSLESRYDNVNRNAAQARNESILLNIVRAGDNAPLNFVAFSRVTTITSATATAGLPTFALGPPPVPTTVGRDVTLSDRSLSASSNVANSMDLTVLDSRDFYTALLSPVDLPTLTFFLRQGYSRELLFRLFTESVRMQIAGKDFEIRNDPRDPCDDVLGQTICFNDMVDVAIASGLTAETRIDRLSTPKKKTAASSSSEPNQVILGRLCFDSVLARRAHFEYSPEIFTKLLAPPASHRPRCGSFSWPKQTLSGSTDTLTFDLPNSRFGPIHFRIVTRSTFGIYQFLGRIIALGETETVQMEARLQAIEDRRLLAVTSSSLDGCFVDVSYKGTNYCIPQRGAEQTKRIFSLLAQLLALKTQASDLAITPTVRVSQ
jgi:hypothetical protein